MWNVLLLVLSNSRTASSWTKLWRLKLVPSLPTFLMPNLRLVSHCMFTPSWPTSQPLKVTVAINRSSSLKKKEESASASKNSPGGTCTVLREFCREKPHDDGGGDSSFSQTVNWEDAQISHVLERSDRRGQRAGVFEREQSARIVLQAEKARGTQNFGNGKFLSGWNIFCAFAT